MSSGPLAPLPPQALRRIDDTPDRARVDLEAARARVEQQLAALERSVPMLVQWREVVRRHPVVSLGAAFLTGMVIARLFSRR